MVQSNSVAHALQDSFGVPLSNSGVVIAIATALVILGGIQSIARVATLIVPVMIVFYIVGGLVVLAINWRTLPEIVSCSPMHSRPPPRSAASRSDGEQGMRYGIARGVFSNESGLGSGAIAAAAARSPSRVAGTGVDDADLHRYDRRLLDYRVRDHRDRRLESARRAPR
jgi:AGCS family alanine or glycine:cation symporter